MFVPFGSNCLTRLEIPLSGVDLVIGGLEPQWQTTYKLDLTKHPTGEEELQEYETGGASRRCFDCPLFETSIFTWSSNPFFPETLPKTTIATKNSGGIQKKIASLRLVSRPSCILQNRTGCLIREPDDDFTGRPTSNKGSLPTIRWEFPLPRTEAEIGFEHRLNSCVKWLGCPWFSFVPCGLC